MGGKAQGDRKILVDEVADLFSQMARPSSRCTGTPSDHRWLQNAYRNLRRGGFVRRTP